MSVRLVVALVCAAATFACGGSTSQDSATGGSAGSSGGGGSGGSGAVSGSGGGGIGGGGSGGTSCGGFADETPPGGVTLRFVNTLSTPIYLGGGNTCNPDPIYDLAGPAGQVQFSAGGCGHTCEALQQHGDWCTDACMIPPVIMINPGGSWDELWSGTTFEPRKMPTSCYFEPQYAPPSCDQRVIAPAGSYAAMAAAGTALTCLDVGMCTCTPSPQGSCQIPYGAYLDSTPLAAKASFEYPSTSLVVITFQ